TKLLNHGRLHAEYAAAVANTLNRYATRSQVNSALARDLEAVIIGSLYEHDRAFRALRDGHRGRMEALNPGLLARRDGPPGDDRQWVRAAAKDVREGRST